MQIGIEWDTVKTDVKSTVTGIVGGLVVLGLIQHGGGWAVAQVWPSLEYPGIAAFFIFLFGITGISVAFLAVLTVYERWTEDGGGD